MDLDNALTTSTLLAFETFLPSASFCTSASPIADIISAFRLLSVSSTCSAVTSTLAFSSEICFTAF